MAQQQFVVAAQLRDRRRLAGAGGAGDDQAAAAVTRRPGLPGTDPETGRDADEPEDTPVEPFGVFDPLNDDSGLW